MWNEFKEFDIASVVGKGQYAAGDANDAGSTTRKGAFEVIDGGLQGNHVKAFVVGGTVAIEFGEECMALSLNGQYVIGAKGDSVDDDRTIVTPSHLSPSNEKAHEFMRLWSDSTGAIGMKGGNNGSFERPFGLDFWGAAFS